MKTERAYRLGFKDSPVTLLLSLCDACYIRRLETGASVLERRGLPFAVPCEDCQARDGKLPR